MSYKGNDLNLRAPYARPLREADATEDDGASWRAPRDRGEPIEVDQTLLACCNDAYEVARFHGSGDVRLEHLLHALTRVGRACDGLEQRGVRTNQLRRETAAAIASDAPRGAGGMRNAPRTSVEVEHVLRRAAEAHVPAGVADTVRALLGCGRDAPAAELLLRAVDDPQQLERWGEEFRALEPSAAPRFGIMQHLGSDMTEALFARLDKLEASWRAFAAEIAADRRAMGEAVRELQRDLHAYRSDDKVALAAGLGGAPALEGRLAELGGTVALVAERLGALDKLAGGDHLAALGARVEAAEGGVTGQSLELATSLANTVTERLAQAEASLQRLHEDGAHSSAAAQERLTGLEAMVRAHLAQAEEAGKAHERDLGEIFAALVKLGTNQQTLGSNLDTWRLDNSGDVSIVSNRLEQMEHATKEALGRLGEEVRLLRSPPALGDDEEGRGNGFKRWLYGTGRVFAASRRETGKA